MAVVLKTREERECLAQAGAELSRILCATARSLTSGSTTKTADERARSLIEYVGARALLAQEKNDCGERFPGVACFSVNDVASHGIPDHRALHDGDLVTVDCAISMNGWCVDAATAVVVGGVPGARTELAAATRAVLESAVGEIGPSVPWERVIRAAEAEATRRRVHIVQGLWGHGIGRRLHEAPALALWKGIDDLVLREGMVLTVEPIVACLPATIRVGSDGWGFVTADGIDACHEEVTVAVGPKWVEVLTPLPDCR